MKRRVHTLAAVIIGVAVWFWVVTSLAPAHAAGFPPGNAAQALANAIAPIALHPPARRLQVFCAFTGNRGDCQVYVLDAHRRCLYARQLAVDFEAEHHAAYLNSHWSGWVPFERGGLEPVYRGQFPCPTRR